MLSQGRWFALRLARQEAGNGLIQGFIVDEMAAANVPDKPLAGAQVDAGHEIPLCPGGRKADEQRYASIVRARSTRGSGCENRLILTVWNRGGTLSNQWVQFEGSLSNRSEVASSQQRRKKRQHRSSPSNRIAGEKRQGGSAKSESATPF